MGSEMCISDMFIRSVMMVMSVAIWLLNRLYTFVPAIIVMVFVDGGGCGGGGVGGVVGVGVGVGCLDRGRGVSLVVVGVGVAVGGVLVGLCLIHI